MVDDNHTDGIGLIHLVTSLHTGVLAGNKWKGDLDPDFREAKVSICLRGRGFDPKGTELVWWTQSQSNIEALNGWKGHGDLDNWRRANWAYTGRPLTKYLLDGKWHKVEFILKNDPCLWTYAGANFKKGTYDRYIYWPIEKCLAHHNCNFVFVLINVHEGNDPTGIIDIDEFKIEYNFMKIPKGKMITFKELFKKIL